MSYLLDTNVVSELRKGPRCDAGVAEWMAGTDERELFLSVLVVGEIRNGIEKVRRRDPAGASALSAWLASVQALHEQRILPVDLRVAEEWGRLAARRSIPVVDGLLAATALVHGLTLVTRNTRDVTATGVALLDPFARSVPARRA